MAGEVRMSVDEYLNQRDLWLDNESGTLVPIETLSSQRRIYAARALMRRATALVLITENERNIGRDLKGVFQLIDRNPKDWITRTPLYGALYRDEREASYTDRVPAEFRPPPLR